MKNHDEPSVFDPDPELVKQDQDTLDRVEAAIMRECKGRSELEAKLPLLVVEALEFVLDPVRTGRTELSDLDQVEKTFIGLKVEHFFRDFIGFPKATRDLVIDGVDVDVKHTVNKNWMIPPETFGGTEPVILIMSAYERRQCSLGIMVAREAWLSKGNRDGKRSISTRGREHIRWLVQNAELPPSRWVGIDMGRFRELRSIRVGNRRAAMFFRENLGRVFHRVVIEALLFDQKDPMKRLRRNGGAASILAKEGIEICSGQYRRDLAERFGIQCLTNDSWVAVKVDGPE